jgi:hypothetical protein
MGLHLLKILLLIGASLTTKVFSAQQRDFVGLTGFKTEYRISRSVDIALQHQNMFNQNLAEWWIAFADASIGYKIKKGWATELHYRLIQFRNANNRYETRQLFFHTLSYTLDLGKWDIVFRSRLQQLTFDELFGSYDRPSRVYHRFRIVPRYKWNYFWSFYFSAEWFTPLVHETRKNPDQWRAGIGAVHSFNDHWKLETYYQIQQQMARLRNNTFFVVGVNGYYLF